MNLITKYIKTLSESLKDNKKIIIICFALFFIIAIIVYFIVHHNITNHLDTFNIRYGQYGNLTSPHVSPLSLFTNNASVVLYSYVGGIFFGIIPLFTLFYNSLALGSQFGVFEFLRPNGFIEYLFYVIPHGIFEIPGTILGSASGLILFKFIWNLFKGLKQSDANTFKDRVRESYQNNKHILIQSLVIIIFALILILIAAPIESNISSAFSRFMLHH